MPEIRAALVHQHELVLEAPPGAGKTTLVPLALLGEPWLGTQKIIMLEPRRLAARAAAERMAYLLGERVGERVGYRIRLDSRVSAATRIEVVTEGVLTRMLQSDPALDGVGLVIFDEFHERSLQADLGLALTLQIRELLRDEQPLKLLVMSATLDGDRVAAMLGGAPVVRSEGRTWPVDLRYGEATTASANVILPVVQTVRRALMEESGSILVFLPGRREISGVAAELVSVSVAHPEVEIHPLYGELTLEQQRSAIEPAAAGRRKVVLATDIAETSLTIDGVRVVVDAGLSRQPSFDPNNGMTRLYTRRLSQASSTQRAGRAGRVEPGVCYRLWSESQQSALLAQTPPEILQADLVPLALQLLSWGVADPVELRWLDAPPAGPYLKALDLLRQLGALPTDADLPLRLTAHGEAMAALPLHPRLAHLLLQGCAWGVGVLAADLAALLSERDPIHDAGADITARLQWLRHGGAASGNHSARKRLQQLSKQMLSLVPGEKKTHCGEEEVSDLTAALIAVAYPDRIAQRRGGESIYRMSSGRAVQLREGDALQSAAWLAVAQAGGRAGNRNDTIFLAAPLDASLFEEQLAFMLKTYDSIVWQERRLVAETQRRIGQLVLSSRPLQNITPALRQQAALELVQREGLAILPWNSETRQLQARVGLLRQLDLAERETSDWPDLADAALLATLADWLGPHLQQVRNRSDLAGLNLLTILRGLLAWPLPQQLDELAPTQMRVPSGSNHRIDYTVEPPVLAVKLQEMFGCSDTPRIAAGRVALMVHLLSPARRPLQVTQDLASFWQNGYIEVKKEMRGRYPKHPWPDDPASAQPTRHTKRRQQQS
jgi:ATP-dependent helicase HrpB